jgi:hypothetical protein
MQANSLTLNQPSVTREAALETLQAAIVRLSVKTRSGSGDERSEIRALVDQALEAYRGYMRATRVQ